jgi:SsrA-binding protein
VAKRNGKDERYADIDRNRRAFYEYEILERLEAGLVLQGTEVKGLRARGASIRDAYAQFREGEAWLVGLHIADWDQPGLLPTDPRRSRKLLLHRREIEQWASKVAERGLTVVPLRLYFKDGRAKVELGLARGKAVHDKRRAIAERDARREMDRAVKAVRHR